MCYIVEDLRFEPRYSSTGSNGQYPDLCMNDNGWIVIAYHKETVLNLRLRYKIGHLHENQITWSSSTVFDKGYYPRVAINNKMLVVTVFASQVSRQVYCRLGKLLDDDSFAVDEATIEWQGAKVLIGEGRNPSVGISNDNKVVVVYERGYLNFHVFYRIGDIVDDREIVWRNSEPLPLGNPGSSKHASVSVNDRGQVAIGYADSYKRSVHLVPGKITSDDTITLGVAEERYTPPGVNYQPVVALNDHGHLVATWHSLQGRLHLRANYGVMRTDESTGTESIKWSLERPSNFALDGYHTSVAVNDKMEVVVSYKSLLSLNINKSVRSRIGYLSIAESMCSSESLNPSLIIS